MTDVAYIAKLVYARLPAMEDYNQQIKDPVICQAWSARPSSTHDFTVCSLSARTLTLQAEG